MVFVFGLETETEAGTPLVFGVVLASQGKFFIEKIRGNAACRR